MDTIYHIADKFFFIFHIVLILFNLFGWIVKPLRKWNLLTLGLTAFSWVVIGIFYGFGYCFLTDWHWQVRENLGYENPYNSYIQFLVDEIFNMQPSETTVDTLTAVLFVAALVISVILNVRDRKKS